LRDVENSGRILIIDDDPVIVQLLRGLLSKAGYSDVHSTTNPAEALALCAVTRPDAVLLDFHMPGPDGLELLEQLRTAPYVADEFLPILMLTGDRDEHTRRQALELGATDFVLKPFDLTEVLLRLRNALAIRDHQRLLEHRVRQRTGELEVARYELLERLALTAEFRDDETHQHTQRVGRTAHLLAETLAPADAEMIGLAAPLHDIGKVGIPDAILLKPSKLTAAEFDRMKQHAEIGKRLLEGSTSPILRAGEQIASTHHERWDGLGYPLGLARDEIPISGRLTAVADVFDALTHERPYKRAVSREDAVAEILASAGTQFDPDVVEVFARLPHDQLIGPPAAERTDGNLAYGTSRHVP
jgi:putative two-component system response regulator